MKSLSFNRLLDQLYPQQDLLDPTAKKREVSFSQLEVIILRLTLAVVFFFSLFDMINDITTKSSPLHIATDILLSTVIILGLWVSLSRAKHKDKNIALLQDAYFTARKDVQDLAIAKDLMLKGFGECIDLQLEQWKLSHAEKEIALLLLKGLSHNEIAEIRNTSERTVRQQSLNVYSKAGVKGRSDLAAFFLEDILNATPTTSGKIEVKA